MLHPLVSALKDPIPYYLTHLLYYSPSFISLSPIADGGISCHNGLYELVGSLTSGLQSQEGSSREQAAIWDKWWELFHCASQEVDCETILTPPSWHTCIYMSYSEPPSPQPVSNQALPWESHWQWMEINVNNAGRCWVVCGGMSFVCVYNLR